MAITGYKIILLKDHEMKMISLWSIFNIYLEKENRRGVWPKNIAELSWFFIAYGLDLGNRDSWGIHFGETTGNLAKAFQAWQKLSEAAGHEEARLRESQEIHLSNNLHVSDPLICLIGAVGNHSSPIPWCYISPLV